MIPIYYLDTKVRYPSVQFTSKWVDVSFIQCQGAKQYPSLSQKWTRGILVIFCFESIFLCFICYGWKFPYHPNLLLLLPQRRVLPTQRNWVVSLITINPPPTHPRTLPTLHFGKKDFEFWESKRIQRKNWTGLGVPVPFCTFINNMIRDVSPLCWRIN